MRQIPNSAATHFGAHRADKRHNLTVPELHEALQLLAGLEHGAAGDLGSEPAVELHEGVREARAQLERLKARFASPDSGLGGRSAEEREPALQRSRA